MREDLLCHWAYPVPCFQPFLNEGSVISLLPIKQKPNQLMNKKALNKQHYHIILLPKDNVEQSITVPFLRQK